MNITITLEDKYLSSRESGTKLRTNIEGILDRKGASITINGTQVLGLSESFADELFGILVKKIGKKRFFTAVNIVGFSEVDLGVIATAIERRLS